MDFFLGEKSIFFKSPSPSGKLKIDIIIIIIIIITKILRNAMSRLSPLCNKILLNLKILLSCLYHS